MAIYFCRASHGKVGKATPHYDYIHGLNKYSYKKDEVVYAIQNIPTWVKNNRDFFEMSDNFERANGMSYKELKLALPSEFSLKENQKLLHEFIEKELGNKYYYSAVIHDKEIEKNKVQQNIHVHLMFSTRELDEIERVGKDFFKRANSNNPKLGGNAKNTRWDSKNTKSLKEIRFSWETTLNKHLQEHGLEKVSSLSLKEQYQNALKDGDKVKAKLLKRKAINIQMRILKKALDGNPLTRWEQNQYKKYLKNKTIKVCLEKDYRETLALQKNIEIKKNLIKDADLNIKSLPKDFVHPKYYSFLDVEKNILMLEKELELAKTANSFSAVKISAINSINKEFLPLHQTLNYYIEKLNSIEESTEADLLLKQKYTKTIAEVKEKIETIETSISSIDFASALKKEITKSSENLSSLQNKKESLVKEREHIYKSSNKNSFILDKIGAHNKLSSILETLADLEWNLKTTNRDLNQIETKLNSTTLRETAKDILTKGEYKKAVEDTKKCIDKINTIVREINGGFYDNRNDLMKEKIEEHKNLKVELERLQEVRFDKFFNENYFKVEKIEKSLKEKLESRKENLFNKRHVLKQEIEFYKLWLLQDKETKDIFTNKYYIYSQKINNSIYYEYKYRTAREALDETFSTINIKKLAYNKITKGAYNKIFKEYKSLDKSLENLKIQKESLGKFSLKGISLSSEISKLEKQKLDLQQKYHSMINAVDTNLLNQTIKEIENVKKQANKNIKSKENTSKQEKFENIFKQNKFKEYEKEIKPRNFENYIDSTKQLHQLQEDSGHSRSLFEDEEERKSLSKFYSEHIKDHENDLEVDF
ncbi:MobA/MobL family protein [Cetobacterium sp.]|uniref:MobA/MobL family protein n=1 Tax=Cetobacterium sp. TaxID=2071632 RepID=UPI0025B9DE99|nr:MobA/MobL family protein [Cetobacterium sp.]